MFQIQGFFVGKPSSHILELRKYYVKGAKNVGKCTKLG